MKKIIAVILLIFGTANEAFSQQLNDYQYVMVPETYEFLEEENKYQLNDMTVFFLEKEGFVVFYEEEIPADIDTCEVLQAKVIDDSGLFTTRLVLNLENCKGELVFTSGEEGKSREKDYRTAHQEALRNAFEVLRQAQYSFTGIGEKIPNTPEKAVAAIAEEISGSEKVVAEKALPEIVEAKTTRDTLKLHNGNKEYVLARSETGYTLFKESEKDVFAKLIRSGSGSNYIYSSGKIQGNAYFDADGNLVVEYLDQGSGQVISIHYSRK